MNCSVMGCKGYRITFWPALCLRHLDYKEKASKALVDGSKPRLKCLSKAKRRSVPGNECRAPGCDHKAYFAYRGLCSRCYKDHDTRQKYGFEPLIVREEAG